MPSQCSPFGNTSVFARGQRRRRSRTLLTLCASRDPLGSSWREICFKPLHHHRYLHLYRGLSATQGCGFEKENSSVRFLARWFEISTRSAYCSWRVRLETRGTRTRRRSSFRSGFARSRSRKVRLRHRIAIAIDRHFDCETHKTQQN